MTEKERWDEEDRIYDTVGGRHEYFFGARKCKLAPDQKRRLDELSCVSMIDSIIAYGGKGLSAQEILDLEKGSYHNYLADHIEKLGEERVLELIQGQLDSIAYVGYAGRDSEGNIYNGIVYKGEGA